MENKTGSPEKEEYLVGYEMKLNEMLKGSDVTPLLKTVVKEEVKFASVTDEKGKYLWSEGDKSSYGSALSEAILNDIEKEKYEGDDWSASPLYHEGEPIGFIFVSTQGSANNTITSRLIEIITTSINLVISNNTKRKLTTEMHDIVMHENYEVLLETNKKLTISEQKYRNLAQSLEQKVKEKTAELTKTTTCLIEREKMAAIGQLAAGIAHEINNPIGFILSNLNTLKKYATNLKEMVMFYRSSFEIDVRGKSQSEKLQSLSNEKKTSASLEFEEMYRELKIDFIVNDVFDLIQQNSEGAERIAQIVVNLKDFSNIDLATNRMIDINKEIKNIINVFAHDIKKRSAIINTDFSKISEFSGNPGLISQLFLNIILNALQSGEKPQINISTKQENGFIIVSIADNGCGIPENIQNRIFEPFFTTKKVGNGTGLGLSVAYDITSAHKGNIKVNSTPGEGANFIVSLPISN